MIAEKKKTNSMITVRKKNYENKNNVLL